MRARPVVHVLHLLVLDRDAGLFVETFFVFNDSVYLLLFASAALLPGVVLSFLNSLMTNTADRELRDLTIRTTHAITSCLYL